MSSHGQTGSILFTKYWAVNKTALSSPSGAHILMSYYSIIFTVMKYILIFYLTTNYFIMGDPEDDMPKACFYEDLQILKNFYR